MKPSATLALSTLLAAATAGSVAWLVTAVRQAPPAPSTADPGPALSRLEDRLQAVLTRLDALESRSEGAALTERRPTPAIDEATIRDAVRAWLEQRAATGDLDLVSKGDERPADAQLDDLLAELATPDLSQADRESIWRRAAAAGLLDEMIERFEGRVASDPDDPDARADLGGAYLSAIEHLDTQAEKSDFAVKADAAFDAALAIDETHWDARFLKALSLSFWPAFLGRGPESVHHFEVLMEQQESSPRKPHFAQTYLYLGNMYAQAGDTDRAARVWQRGLREFPNDDSLRTRLGN
jgi:tetratricopeptide (TPR) repeat protein